MAKVERLELKNKKGLRLAANLHIPDGAGPFPAVLVLHGFLGFKDETHITYFAAELCRAGFLALRFDMSGFGESEGDPEREFRISNYLSDAHVALEYLKTNARAIQSKVAVCGHSLGASIALILAADADVAACSAVQPSTKTTRSGGPRELAQWEPAGWVDFESECPRYRKFRLPREFALDADKFDVREWVGRIKCPLQIMYGTDDATVLPENTLSIFERAPAGTELVKLAGVNHDFGLVPDKLALVTNELLGFLKKQVIIIQTR